MGNHAYLSLWFREFSIEKGLAHLEKALGLFPLSGMRPGFRLVVRSLDPGESPTLEADLLATPADVRAAAAEFLHEDTCYEVTAWWDRWQPGGAGGWQTASAPVEFLLHGEQFDDGRYREAGHLLINVGPEALYLGAANEPAEVWQRCAQENVRGLFALLRSLEEELPLAERRLWSEGEDDFATRAEQLLQADT